MTTLKSDAGTPRTASPRTYRLNEIGLLVAIVVLYVVLTASAAGFLTAGNQLGILRDAATIGIAAWGVTLVIIAGDIDISIGPAVAFSSVLVAKGSAEWGLGIVGAIVMTLVLGTLWGALAGYLRAQFNVPSFITTLGVWSILGGLALYLTDALPVVLPPSGLMDVLGGNLLGVPTSAIVMLLLFATTGLLSAITGVLVAARLGSGNGGAASGLEFDVIAAVVIGGTLLAGGRGSMLGTLLGVVFITVIAN